LHWYMLIQCFHPHVMCLSLSQKQHESLLSGCFGVVLHSIWPLLTQREQNRQGSDHPFLFCTLCRLLFKGELRRKMNLWSEKTFCYLVHSLRFVFMIIKCKEFTVISKNCLVYNASIWGHLKRNRLLIPLTRLKIAPH